MITILIIVIILGSLYITWVVPRIILMEIYHCKMDTKPIPSGREYMKQLEKERKDD